MSLLLLTLILAVETFLRVDGEVGSACTVHSSQGVCQLIDNCASVKNELLQGRPPPNSFCGFKGRLPIVCCPTSGPDLTSSTTTTTTTTSSPISGTSPRTSTREPSSTLESRPARQMCAKYAKEVYSFEPAHAITGGDRQMINVSLCAIKEKKLIVGGTEAEPKEFPHMAALGYVSQSKILWNCGGTLISDQYVLTAAHCTSTSRGGNVEWVRVGDLNLHSHIDDGKPQDRRVVQRIRHPNYVRPAAYNDVALLKLESPVDFNAYVRPACLTLKPQRQDGEKAVASGWGLVDWHDDTRAETLLKVTLPVVPPAQCRSFFKFASGSMPDGINEASQLCAGEEGKDTCQGDSGGPLAVYSAEEECMYEVIGITSVGKDCGSLTPGVYTRVYNYLSWIEGIVWPDLL